MPRKRKHSDEEEEEDDALEAENGVRGKRKAAMEARAKAKVVARDDSDDEEEQDHDENEEDDDDDEDFEGGEEEDEEEDDEGADSSKENGEEANDEEENENEVDEDDEDVDADAVKVDCIEAELEEPSKDVEGYVLKKAEKGNQQLEMWFSEEMSETIGDVTEAFNSHYENKKLPVLQVTKFDVIEETNEIYQIDVLEAKYDKAYTIREKDKTEDTNLAWDLYSLVRVDGTDKIWATQYFMPEED